MPKGVKMAAHLRDRFDEWFKAYEAAGCQKTIAAELGVTIGRIAQLVHAARAKRARGNGL